MEKTEFDTEEFYKFMVENPIDQTGKSDTEVFYEYIRAYTASKSKVTPTKQDTENAEATYQTFKEKYPAYDNEGLVKKLKPYNKKSTEKICERIEDMIVNTKIKVSNPKPSNKDQDTPSM